MENNKTDSDALLIWAEGVSFIDKVALVEKPIADSFNIYQTITHVNTKEDGKCYKEKEDRKKIALVTQEMSMSYHKGTGLR